MSTAPLRLALLLGSLVGPALALPQGAPPGYYNTVDDSTPAALRSTLHQVIDDHVRLSYTSSGVDTWFVLERAQTDPSNPNNILDVYRNDSLQKFSGNYNREHTWPRSYGFPDDGSDNYPFTDCHMLRLCNPGYNSARSNKPYRFCASTCSEFITAGGTSGQYPGTSNWTSGSFSSGTWEVWADRRGDVARGLLYADLRYEGGNHGTTGIAEPDLILTDNNTLIANSNTGQNESVAYMGSLSALLAWHASDPVDDFERARNDEVFQWQGNRNPFVDNPEWVDCLYNDDCGFADVYCAPAVPNSSGFPASMDAQGSLAAADNDFTLFAQQMPTNQFGYFLTSQTEDFVIGAGGSQGNLCLGGQIGRYTGDVQNTGIFGTFQLTLDLTAMPVGAGTAVLPGDTWRFQCWFRDGNPTPTSNFTDALRLTFQ